jgi:hypothetical protein
MRPACCRAPLEPCPEPSRAERWWGGSTGPRAADIVFHGATHVRVSSPTPMIAGCPVRARREGRSARMWANAEATEVA